MKKSLYITLTVSLFVLAVAVLLLPELGWDLRPLPGWPMVLAWSPLLAAIAFARLCSPWRKKETSKMKRWIHGVVSVLVMAGLIVLHDWNDIGRKRVDGYIHSPNGANTAVLLNIGIKSRVAYPLRHRYFYEVKDGNSAMEYESWTYEWIDENTLEFVSVMYTPGETEVQRIRW